MRFGSLFSGIGGLDLGLERAGMRCAWQVESDPYCVRVLERHWPDLTRKGDIRECDGRDLEAVDLMAGGFPCQDISLAGKGAGLSGERSGLFFELVRLVRILRPRYVLQENVTGLLGRGMGRVLGELSALGYDAEWECVPAAAFGAPHLRWRIFIVAYTDREHGHDGRYGAGSVRGERPAKTDLRRGEDVAHAESDRRRTRWARGLTGTGEGIRAASALSTMADPDDPRLERRVFDRERAGEQLARARSRALSGVWKSEPRVGRVANGIPNRVDRLGGLGNAVVPQVGQWLGHLILDHERRCMA